MDDETESDALQEALRTNVKVLMAIRGIDTASDLARRMDRSENHIARQLAGGRAWRLADLPALARVLGVKPAALLSDTAELVGAATHPTGSVSRAVSDRYHGTNDAKIIPFPQVAHRNPRYLTAAAQVITLGRRDRAERVASLTGVSARTVKTVTAAVGT